MQRWVAGVVLFHLVISMVHGSAHQAADVPLSPAATAFVFVVIVAGPLVGLVLTRWARGFGAWLIAATMAGSLVFGVVNHFLVAGPDHVAHVVAPERLLFALTAVLLAVTEALGSMLALRLARAGKLER